MDYYGTESIKLMIDHSKQSLKLSRSTYLANKIVIVDGLPGCGKTMLSPILSSFDRVELISYAFEVEWICRLNYLKKIDKDAANFMVHNLIDHKIYQTMSFDGFRLSSFDSSRRVSHACRKHRGF